MKKFVKIISCFLFFLSSAAVFSQEALKSIEEEYYDFLALQGLVERPSLNYRTLSDSKWHLSEEAETSDLNIWKNNNLGTTKKLSKSITFKFYGLEWFNSYNTKAPYGQNDGALWQGKGYNTSFSTGFRFEGYGFELTLKPQLSWSQNKEFEYITPAYSGSAYSGKADRYGYYGVVSVDAPQRFGNSSFATFDWGDSEVRYSWNSFTVGAGTQAIWLGPAKLNPILHSNNAPSYPKFDLGLRKTELGNFGAIEGRSWWGKLTESDWFDNDDSNDNTLISGFSFSYSFPGIFKGLTIGLNRTMLSKWEEIDAYTLFNIYGKSLRSGGNDNSDQRFSFTLDWLFTNAGLEMYLEWGRNDFSTNTDYILRYPFHSQGWTGGIEKVFDINDSWKLNLMLEITVLECSDDYERVIDWYSTFYAHHIITQGYTNRGQWLGAGIGTGGNSQYLGANLMHKKGNVLFFIQRRNPDLDYTFHIHCKEKNPELDSGNQWAEKSIRAMLDFGLESNYYVTNNIVLNSGIVFINEHNPLNEGNITTGRSKHRYNCNIVFGVKCSL